MSTSESTGDDGPEEAIDQAFDNWLREISDRFDTAVGASINVEAELAKVKRRAADDQERWRGA